MNPWPDNRPLKVESGWPGWSPPAGPWQVALSCWSPRPPEGSWWRKLWWRWRREAKGTTQIDQTGIAWSEVGASPVEVLRWDDPWLVHLNVWPISPAWAELSVELRRTGGGVARRVGWRVVLPQLEVSQKVEIKQSVAPYLSLADFRRLWPVLRFHAEVAGHDLDGLVGPVMGQWPRWDVVEVNSVPVLAGGETPAWVRNVLVSPDEFMMGSPTQEPHRDADELHHLVRVSRPFLVQAAPVTQAQWRDLMGRGSSRARFKGDEHPMESINWYQALAWCNARSRAEGLEEAYVFKGASGRPRSSKYTVEEVVWKGLDCGGWRLLTEAEWELACRGGWMGVRYGAVDEIAWTRNNAEGRTHPVASLAPNSFGIHDMLGNVWEWCWDIHGLFEKDEIDDPVGPVRGQNRVIRGGSWDNYDSFARAASRGKADPTISDPLIGFRCARTLIRTSGQGEV